MTIKTTTKLGTARSGSGLPLPRLLSMEDTAEVLGCSIKTLRRMIDAKTLPVVRLGRLIRVHPEDLTRLSPGIAAYDRSCRPEGLAGLGSQPVGRPAPSE